MPSTDIDGSPILILSREDAEVLIEFYNILYPSGFAIYPKEIMVFRKIQDFVNKSKINEN